MTRSATICSFSRSWLDPRFRSPNDTVDIHEDVPCWSRAPIRPAATRDTRLPWPFTDFLADRAVRKPSPHTIKAYRQDFEAIATLLTGTPDAVPDLRTNELTKDTLRTALAPTRTPTQRPRSGVAGRRGTRCARSCSPRNCPRPIRCL